MEASRIDGRYRLLVHALVRMHRSRRIKWALTVGSVAVVIVLVLLAARHFATTSWPLSTGHPALLFAVGLLLVLAQWLKAYGWGRLFTKEERPKPLALAAANGGAALIGVALPGRFDDAMQCRRSPLQTLSYRCARALPLARHARPDRQRRAPLALAAAVSGTRETPLRRTDVVAVAGLAAAAIIVALPRVVASRHCSRFRLGRWLTPRTTSLRRASQAWSLVLACWVVRAGAVFLLLGALGIGYSLPLALVFLCAGAAAAALPIGPGGAATQVGAGAAALIASGVGASQALSFAVSIATLGVLTGTAVLVFAVVLQSTRALMTNRPATRLGLKRAHLQSELALVPRLSPALARKGPPRS